MLIPPTLSCLKWQIVVRALKRKKNRFLDVYILNLLLVTLLMLLFFSNVCIEILYKTWHKNNMKKLKVSYGNTLGKSNILFSFSYHTHWRFFYPYEIVFWQVRFLFHGISKVFLPRIVVDINNLWIKMENKLVLFLRS